MHLLNISDLCRACLTSGANIPIFDTSNNNDFKDLCTKLRVCLGEQVEDIYGYPRNICKVCNSILDQIIIFVNKYRESDKILKQNLNSDTIKEENNDDHCCETLLYEEREIKKEIITEENKDIDSSGNEFKNCQENSIKTNQEIGIQNNDDHCCKTLLFEEGEIKNEMITEENKDIDSSDNELKNCQENSIKTNQEIGIRSQSTSKVLIKKTSNARSKIRQKVNKTSKFKSKDKVSKRKKSATSSRQQSKALKETEKPKDKGPSTHCLCDHCGATFHSKTRLADHINCDHFKKPPTCSYCSKTFTSQDGLRKHSKLMHTGEKRFICTECGKGFVLKHILDKHIKIKHTNEYVKKLYDCSFCGKLYSTKQVLLIHKRSVHTGERPELCTVCNARFTHHSYLKEHMRLHNGETPFKCPVCGKGHTQHSNMKSHIKHNHRLSQLDEEQLKTIHQRYLKVMQP